MSWYAGECCTPFFLLSSCSAADHDEARLVMTPHIMNTTGLSCPFRIYIRCNSVATSPGRDFYSVQPIRVSTSGVAAITLPERHQRADYVPSYPVGVRVGGHAHSKARREAGGRSNDCVRAIYLPPSLPTHRRRVHRMTCATPHREGADFHGYRLLILTMVTIPLPSAIRQHVSPLRWCRHSGNSPRIAV